MMKGKTTIELFNAETGKLEASYEDENIVTNAVAYLMNIEAASGESLNTNVFPIATNALGGLMLFDGELEESVDNVHLPTKDVHLVAYASTDTNTSDPNRGSFNVLESGARDGGYVSVWDFGTSQANGIIKSVARTHKFSASDPIRYYEGAVNRVTAAGCPSNDTDWYPIRYDGEYVYMMKYDSSSKEMRESRVRKPMLRMKVGDYSGLVEEYEPVSTFDALACQFEYTDAVYTRRTMSLYCEDPKYYYDGNDGFYYCCYAGYDATKEGGFVFNWFTINYGDGSYEKSELHQITLQAKVLCNVSYVNDYDQATGKYTTRYYQYMSSPVTVRINNGYMYLITSNRKSILRVNLNNQADQVSIKVIEDGSRDYISDLHQINLRNGGVFFTIYHILPSGGSQHRNGLMYQDGYVFLHNIQGASNQYDWFNDSLVNGAELERFGYKGYTSICRGFIANYLGTINNLTSPIEKNASQTMKVTYTLTDVDETMASSDEEVTG